MLSSTPVSHSPIATAEAATNGMAMMIAATDLGIGTGHSSVGDQEKARAILGVPDDHLVAFMLGIGHPADRPLTPIRKPNRRPFSEVVHHGRW